MPKLRMTLAVLLQFLCFSCAAQTPQASAITFSSIAFESGGPTATLNISDGYLRVAEMKFSATKCPGSSRLAGPCFYSDYFDFNPTELFADKNGRVFGACSVELAGRNIDVVLLFSKQKTGDITFLYNQREGLLGWKMTSDGASDIYVMKAATLLPECMALLR